MPAVRACAVFEADDEHFGLNLLTGAERLAVAAGKEGFRLPA